MHASKPTFKSNQSFSPDFRRCGNESAQCIKVTSTCDGINDCINLWDESLTTCYTEVEQLRFPTPGYLHIPVVA